MPPADTAFTSDAIHVLITGFGPFRNYSENPSWLAVKALHDAILSTTKAQHASSANGAPRTRQIYVTVLEVPVVYENVLQIVPGLHKKPPVLPSPIDPAFTPTHLPSGGFDFILHVGVAKPGGVSLEQLGHKLGYNAVDAENKYAPVVQVPDGSDGETQPMRGFGKGYEGMPEELSTVIDIAGLKQHLQELGTEKVRWSRDARHYLCDFIYYASLAEAKRSAAEQAKMTPVLFLHCCPQGEPYQTEEVTDVIKAIVTWVSARL
ncbi:uncharacterized protein PHACADRAFT_200515 [Phanerochaete carnosa HHB-10118-sp]|uniref:Peptidase C15, pyroglutamyl peptidase I-like protein n=1 Tax=Phanerochaete carnosa (strain HHB-10118-sp) TaxID=650164 RepID=K5ULL0_PHACS|nr:uncharacterized protein PHACADRAFT_200515 [Phanerochaete carnosa HHB-10118-sp]EKM50566.1 hypothetical protein PHACADRAFT_200515 [Phanerochaete carnosa HHB-10118-sp]